MKKVIICMVILSLLGCSDPIGIVKDGSLEINKATTVGKALDNYKYFSKTDWKTFKTDNGQTIVQFNGTIDINKLLSSDLINSQSMMHFPVPEDLKTTVAAQLSIGAITKVQYVMQFQLLMDKSFKPSYVGMEAVCGDGKIESGNLGNDEITAIIQSIYNNSPCDRFLFQGFNPVYSRWEWLIEAKKKSLEADHERGKAAFDSGNHLQALQILQPLAEKGDTRAVNTIGAIYAQGKDVPQDFEKAAKLFQQAAEKGLDKAQFNLANLYLKGQGVQQDYAAAANWYRKAAEQGFAPAQANLGILYETGKGVTKNREEALKWLKMADDQGSHEAKEMLARLSSRPKEQSSATPPPTQDQGYRGIDGNITPEKAMLAIFGNFNISDKTSIWKSITPREQLESSGFSGDDGLVTAEFAQIFTEGGRDKFIIVVKTIPHEEDFSCHACSPIIGVASFVRSGSKWNVETVTKFVTTSGGYGEIPKVKLIQLGNDKHGLRFDGSGGGMGYFIDYMFIVANQGSQFKEVLSLTTREDATDSCDSDKCNWKYIVNVDQIKVSNSDFYDIRTLKVGTVNEEEKDKISAVNETAFYTFDNTKYKYVLSKKIVEPIPVNEVKSPRVTSARTEPNTARAEANTYTSTVSSSTQEVKIDYSSDATPLVVSMINYARDEAKLGSFKSKLDGLPKPQKGNKVKARKLNDEALGLMKQSKDSEAIPLLETAHLADPSDVEIVNNLAGAYYNTAFANNDFGKAKSRLVDTLRLKPDRNIAWANLGRIFAMEGNEFAATNCYINFCRFSKNREKALQSLSKGTNDPNPLLSKAFSSAYQYVSTGMPAR